MFFSQADSPWEFCDVACRFFEYAVYAEEEVTGMNPSHEGAPLKGLRVVELGHIVAGPTVGMVMHQMGADVTKVEEPVKGDSSRSSPVPGTFVYLNRGKRSRAIDLKTDSGRREFDEVLSSADVFVTNYRENVLRKLGLGPDSLHKRFPSLIYARISGYPPGARYGEPALDEVIQMETGLAAQTGPKDRPLRAGASVIDMTSALFVVIGIQAALSKRNENGQGMYVESSLLEAGLFFMGSALASYQLSGVPPVSYAERDGGAARVHGWGIYDVFTSEDGAAIFIAATSNSQWQALCEALGLTQLAFDERYQSNADRLHARSELVPLVGDAIGKRKAGELMAELRRSGVAHGQVRKPEEVLAWTEMNDLLVHGRAGEKELRLPGLPVRWWDMSDDWSRWAQGVVPNAEVEVVPELGGSDAQVTGGR